MEIADLQIYLIRLADVLGVVISDAIRRASPSTKVDFDYKLERRNFPNFGSVTIQSVGQSAKQKLAEIVTSEVGSS